MILDGGEERAKYCPDCRRDLPASAFTKNSRNRDGLSFYCRECRIVRDEAYRRARLGPRIRRVRPRGLDVPEGSKWCPECGSVKPLELFPRNRSTTSGYMTYCKPCHNQVGYDSRAKNGGARNYHLRRRYGITAEHFDQMFAEQDGLCAICREAPAQHVDHDHKTKRVRGLLCFNCNGALGQFRDRRDLMLRAVAYLDRDPGTPFGDMPEFGYGVFLGDFTSQRPDEEPWEAGFVA